MKITNQFPMNFQPWIYCEPQKSLSVNEPEQTSLRKIHIDSLWQT